MRRLAVLVATLLLTLPGTAGAQCPRTSVADIEDEVMCPVCGTPLALNQEAPQAIREREFILGLVQRCRSKEEIKAALAAEFGEEVLAVPDDSGFELAAYLVPLAVLVLGGAGIAVAALRWRRRRPDRGATPDAAAAAPAPSASDSARLEADLERYDL